MRTLAPLLLAVSAAAPAVCAAQQVALRAYTVRDGLAHDSVTRVFEDSRGYLWFATADGVSRFDGERFVTYRPTDGLPASEIVDIGETNGALWLAARSGHAVRLNESAGPTFVPHPAVTPAERGRMSLPTSAHRHIFADRATPATPLMVRGTSALVTDILEDASGSLWIASSGSGVFVAHAELVVTYTAADELPDQHVLHVVESRDGRIYAMTRRGGVAELREDGVEAVPGSLFAPFHTIGRRIAQDETGTWWFRTDAGVFSAAGPSLSFARARAVAEPPVQLPVSRGAFTDSRGWTWEPLAAGGVSRCTERGCLDYSSADGVAHVVTSIAEDTFGRVYFGTAKGLLRFDPREGRFRAVSLGSTGGAQVNDCMRDSRGRLWVSTTRGASYIVPRLPRRARSAQVYVTAMRVGDLEAPLPPRGTSQFGPVEVRGNATRLEVQFAAPSMTRGEPVTYEHRLAPFEQRWSARRKERTVAYEALRPGIYTFEVRAVAADGTTTPAASVRVQLSPPIWSGWWALGAVAAVLLAGRTLRQLQRADGRRDLAGVPLRVLGGMEEQPEHAGRHSRASDAPRIFQG